MNQCVPLDKSLRACSTDTIPSTRIPFALCRDLHPSSPVARISEVSGTPRSAAFYVLLAVIVGYAVMRVARRDRMLFSGVQRSEPWPLLVAYLFVVVSAAGALLRESEQRMRWMLFILASRRWVTRPWSRSRCSRRASRQDRNDKAADPRSQAETGFAHATSHD
jgi:hypothetical protein